MISDQRGSMNVHEIITVLEARDDHDMDTEKMRALALAATQGKRRWWPARDGDHDYAQIAAGPKHIAQVRIRSITEADLNLFVALDPAAVLDLITEVERRRAKPTCQREDILGAVARGWCAPMNAAKEMDIDLVNAIVVEIENLLTP